MAIETTMSAEEVRAHRCWGDDLEGLPLEHQIRAIEVTERAMSRPLPNGRGVPHAEVVAMIDEVRQRRQVQQ